MRSRIFVRMSGVLAVVMMFASGLQAPLAESMVFSSLSLPAGQTVDPGDSNPDPPSLWASFEIVEVDHGAKTIVVDGSGSGPVDEIVDYHWTFGDGHEESGPALTQVTHQYTIDGKYTVRLLVTTGEGEQTASSEAVQVGENPMASFVYDVNGPKVVFRSTSEPPFGRTLVHYEWDFGDQTSAMGAEESTTSHTYAGSGWYGVTLTIQDSAGAGGTRTVWIAIELADDTAISCVNLSPSTTQLYCWSPGKLYVEFVQQPQDTRSVEILSEIIVVIKTAQGAIVSGVPIPVSVSLEGGSKGAVLEGTVTKTPEPDGSVRFDDLVVRKTGTGYNLVAEIEFATTPSSPFDVSSGPAFQLEFKNRPTNTIRNHVMQPAVIVRVADSWGNTVTSAPISIVMTLGSNPTGASLKGTTIRDARNGVAVFDDLAITRVGSPYTLVASPAFGFWLRGSESPSFSVVSAGPVFIIQPADAVAGATMAPVVVEMQDSLGNRITSSSGTIIIELADGPTDAVLFGTRKKVAKDGIAIFDDLRIERAGNYRLEAVANTVTESSQSFRITSAMISGLAFVKQPTNSFAKTTMDPPVVVATVDPFGNVNATQDTPVIIGTGSNPTGGVLFGAKEKTTQNGVAVFDDLSIDAFGSGYTLLVASGNFPATTSATFDILARMNTHPGELGMRVATHKCFEDLVMGQLAPGMSTPDPECDVLFESAPDCEALLDLIDLEMFQDTLKDDLEGLELGELYQALLEAFGDDLDITLDDMKTIAMEYLQDLDEGKFREVFLAACRGLSAGPPEESTLPTADEAADPGTGSGGQALIPKPPFPDAITERPLTFNGPWKDVDVEHKPFAALPGAPAARITTAVPSELGPPAARFADQEASSSALPLPAPILEPAEPATMLSAPEPAVRTMFAPVERPRLPSPFAAQAASPEATNASGSERRGAVQAVGHGGAGNPLPPVPDAPLLEPDALHYAACGKLEGHPWVCEESVILGSPTALDLDQDVGTGAPLTGAEVVVVLAETANPEFPGGLSMRLDVQRTERSSLGASDLPAQVFVSYESAAVGGRIVAGFDGTPESLADSAEARVTIKDLLLALANDIRVRAEVTHQAARQVSGLMVAYARSGEGTDVSDTKDVHVLFNPMPETIQADLRLLSLGERTEVEAALSTALRTTATVAVEVVRGDSTTSATSVIDKLPLSMHGRIVIVGGDIELEYASTSIIERLTVEGRHYANALAKERKTRFGGEIFGLPSALNVTFRSPMDLEYAATGRILKGTLVLEEYDEAGLAKAIEIAAQGIPSAFALNTTTAPLSINYSATDNLDLMAVTVHDREVELEGFLRLEDVPQQVSLRIDDAHAKLEMSAPIGLVAGNVSIRGGQAASKSGNHLIYRNEGNGLVGVSLRIEGLQDAEYDLREPGRIIVETGIVGAAPFHIELVDTFAEKFLNASLSNLPTNLTLSVSPNALTYSAAGEINRVEAVAHVAGLEMQTIVEGVPTHLDVIWDGAEIKYNASDEIARIWTDLYHGPSDTRAVVEILGFPRMLQVTLDPQRARVVAEPEVARITADVRRHGLGAPSLPGQHLSVVFASEGAFGLHTSINRFKSAGAGILADGSLAGDLRILGNQSFQVRVEDLAGESYTDANLSNVPERMSFVTNESSFRYEASDMISLVNSFTSREGLDLEVALERIPAALELAWEGKNLSYDATGPIGRAWANLAHTTSDRSLRAIVECKGIPQSLTVSATRSHVVLNSSAPVDKIHIDLRVNGTSAPRFSGPHLSYVASNTPSIGHGVSLLLHGFKSAEIHRNSAGETSGEVSITGNESFRLLINRTQRAETEVGLYGELAISNLPGRITYQWQPEHLEYHAAAPIDRLDSYTRIQSAVVDPIRADLAAAVQIENLPSGIEVSVGDGSVQYVASERIERLLVNVYRDDGLNDLHGMVEVAGLPEALVIDFEEESRYLAVTASSPVERVAADIRANSVSAPVLTGQHVSFQNATHTQSGFGLSLMVEGFQAAFIDRRIADRVGFETRVIGNDTFQLRVDDPRIDDPLRSLYAELVLSNLPSRITYNGTTDNIHYDSESRIDQIEGYAHIRGNISGVAHETIIGSRVDQSPGRFDLAFNDTGLNYNASTTINRVHANMILVNQSDDIHALVDLLGIPEAFHFGFKEDDSFFEVSTSSPVDRITADVRRNGIAAPSLPGPHLSFQNATTPGEGFGLSLILDGFQYAQINRSVENELFAEVLVTGNKTFQLRVDDPRIDDPSRSIYAEMSLSNLPESIRVRTTPGVIQYAAEDTIDQIDAFSHIRGPTGAGDILEFSAAMLIEDIPGNVTITMDPDNKRLAYQASARIGSIHTDASIIRELHDSTSTAVPDHWEGSVRIRGVPAQWEAHFGNGTFGFTVPAKHGPLESIQVRLSNTGSVSFPADDAGDHLGLLYRAGSEASGGLPGTHDQVALSFQAKHVQKVFYGPRQPTPLVVPEDTLTPGTPGPAEGPGIQMAPETGGSTFRLQMGSAEPFRIVAEATHGEDNQTNLYALLDPLPAWVEANITDIIHVRAAANFDIHALLEHGHSSALPLTPTPPVPWGAEVPHGISIRDGPAAGAGDPALKARLHLTGVPTSLIWDSANNHFGFTDFKPAESTLTLDVNLTHLTETPTQVAARLTGFSSEGQSLSFALGKQEWIDSGVTTVRTTIDAVTDRPLGEAWAQLGFEDPELGAIQITTNTSALPREIHVVFDERTDATRAGVVTMSEGIGWIGSSIRIGDLVEADLHLAGLPSVVQFELGMTEDQTTQVISRTESGLEATIGVEARDVALDASFAMAGDLDGIYALVLDPTHGQTTEVQLHGVPSGVDADFSLHEETEQIVEWSDELTGDGSVDLNTHPDFFDLASAFHLNASLLMTDPLDMVVAQFGSAATNTTEIIVRDFPAVVDDFKLRMDGERTLVHYEGEDEWQDFTSTMGLNASIEMDAGIDRLQVLLGMHDAPHHSKCQGRLDTAYGERDIQLCATVTDVPPSVELNYDPKDDTTVKYTASDDTLDIYLDAVLDLIVKAGPAVLETGEPLSVTVENLGRDTTISAGSPHALLLMDSAPRTDRLSVQTAMRLDVGSVDEPITFQHDPGTCWRGGVPLYRVRAGGHLGMSLDIGQAQVDVSGLERLRVETSSVPMTWGFGDGFDSKFDSLDVRLQEVSSHWNLELAATVSVPLLNAAVGCGVGAVIGGALGGPIGAAIGCAVGAAAAVALDPPMLVFTAGSMVWPDPPLTEAYIKEIHRQRIEFHQFHAEHGDWNEITNWQRFPGTNRFWIDSADLNRGWPVLITPSPYLADAAYWITYTASAVDLFSDVVGPPYGWSDLSAGFQGNHPKAVTEIFSPYATSKCSYGR